LLPPVGAFRSGAFAENLRPHPSQTFLARSVKAQSRCTGRRKISNYETT
jgi:hypothetical protein